MAALVGMFAISTLGLRDGFNVWVDGWVQGIAYVAVAVLAVLRPMLDRIERGLWLLVAGALAARATGFVLFLGIIRWQRPIPYPSIADAAWLMSAGLLGAALLRVARLHLRRLPLALTLDGVVGVCATGSVALAVLPAALERLSPPDVPQGAVVVNAAYPLIDVVLLLLVLGVVISHHWRPSQAVWLLAVGVAGIALLDTVFLYQVSTNTFRPATPFSGLSLVVTAAIAFAAWTRQGTAVPPRGSQLPGLLVPGALALTCLALLVVAAYSPTRPVPASSVVLAAAGVGAAVLRTAVGFRDIRLTAADRGESSTDELTGLPNRRAFNDAVTKALRGRSDGRPLAVLLLDLDGFKDVNDSLGHHRGDELLSLIAPRLQLAVRPGDVLARIGGDEFAVLADGADSALVEQMATRLRASCRGPFKVASRTVTMEASVGIALFPREGRNSHQLLQHADIAMYGAKDQRSGHSFYRDDYHQQRKTRLDVIADLRAGLDGGAVVVHYQPKVSLPDGMVIGVEALVRWQHPTQGLLAPAAFLPQAEAGGLMRELTLSVLSQALGQWAAWSAAGVETTMAVNLSVGDLLDPGFPSLTAQLLGDHAVPGRALVLELTEDILLADPTHGRSAIAKLLAQDVRVQIDDYGTGFSTLGYLRDLPELGGVKLDRSYVKNLVSDPRSLAIVESTISLADALGLELIAEGVETVAVRDQLVALGCRQAQGYLFCSPLPAAQVPFGIIGETPPQRPPH